MPAPDPIARSPAFATDRCTAREAAVCVKTAYTCTCSNMYIYATYAMLRYAHWCKTMHTMRRMPRYVRYFNYV